MDPLFQSSAPPPDPEPEKGSPSLDGRLYVPRPDRISLQVKTSPERVYCFAHLPGEDHFHLIATGEIYLKTGHEVYCLNCAERTGLVTRNRQFWQRRESWHSQAREMETPDQDS